MSSNTSSYNKLVERLMSAHTSQKSMGDLQSIINDDEISDSQADTTESADSRKGRSKTRNRNPADRIPRPSSFLFKGTGKNCRSHRRSRRYENAMYLATYVAETEEDFYNFDVTPEHNNAFTRLLQDPKQLQVWQEFLELTGEEQDKIVFKEEISENQVASKVQKTATIRATTGREEMEIKGVKSHYKKNTVPSISAKDISYLFKRHNPPLDTLECIEDELRDLFSEDSNTVLVYMETSRYFSLLLSAVAKHLDLSLKRFSAPGGLCLIELECDKEFSESQKYLVDIIRLNKRFSH